MKEIKIQPGDTYPMSEVMTLLTPATGYIVSLAPRNYDGYGPADRQLVTTKAKSVGGSRAPITCPSGLFSQSVDLQTSLYS